MPMQPALDRTMLDRLIDLGRRRGEVTTADLRANLPVHAMSAEEIARIVVGLEEAGIAVELEADLLLPGPQAAPPKTGAEIIPFPKRDGAPRKARTPPGEAAAMLTLPNAKAPPPQESRSRVHAIVAVGLVVLALAGALGLVWGA